METNSCENCVELSAKCETCTDSINKSNRLNSSKIAYEFFEKYKTPHNLFSWDVRRDGTTNIDICLREVFNHQYLYGYRGYKLNYWFWTKEGSLSPIEMKRCSGCQVLIWPTIDSSPSCVECFKRSNPNDKRFDVVGTPINFATCEYTGEQIKQIASKWGNDAKGMVDKYLGDKPKNNAQCEAEKIRDKFLNDKNVTKTQPKSYLIYCLFALILIWYILILSGVLPSLVEMVLYYLK